MKEDPNQELCKFLICKLGLDIIRNPASKLDFLSWFVRTKPCSCSNKPWKCRPNVKKLEKPQSWRISKPNNITLPPSSCHNSFNHRDAVRRNDRFATSITPLALAISSHGSMLNVGCTTVMNVSVGSDFLFYDYDTYDDIVEKKKKNSNDDCVVHQLSSEWSFVDKFDGCFKKNWDSPPKLISELKNNKPSPSEKALDLGRKLRSSHLPEQDFPTLIDIMQVPSPNGISWMNCVNSNDDDDDEEEYWQTFNLSTPKGRGSDAIFNAHGNEDAVTHDFQTGHDQASPYRKRTNSMGKSSKFSSEKVSKKDHNEINEKLFTTPLPFSPFNRKGIIDEDLADGSFKDILVHKRCSQIERSESELDELCVKEIEGESLIAKLRRQVEFDRKIIIKFYEEMDKERNAAAEAASQAMAMITKLQEEKALIDLDALQCVRMMEEQAEHDSVALEKAYDLLAMKEHELQDLEAELVFYRSKYSDEHKEEQIRLTRKHTSVIHGKNRERERLQTHSMKTNKGKSLDKHDF